MNQDNLCNRDDECKQSNEGQEIDGNDNSAAGSNDQSNNISPRDTATSAISPKTQGPAGASGFNGTQGPQGIQGLIGPNGSRGPE